MHFHFFSEFLHSDIPCFMAPPFEKIVFPLGSFCICQFLEHILLPWSTCPSSADVTLPCEFWMYSGSWNQVTSILQLHYSFLQLFLNVNLKTFSCEFIGRAPGPLDGDCAESGLVWLEPNNSVSCCPTLPPGLWSALGVFSVQILYVVCKIYAFHGLWC